MTKKLKQAEGFNLLVPFSIKAGEAEDLETLKISGIANFCGDLEDPNCIEVDLAGEVVVPSGMDLKIYKQNPQILWQHTRDYSVGVCDKITKKADGIYIEATIHKGAMEEEDWYRVKNGLVTRLSVGFRCKGGEYKEINGRQVYFITKSLLLEISLVSIPASSSSAFSVIKSLGEDTEGIYSGELYEVEKELAEEVNIPIGDTMKIKMLDILSETDIAKFKSLGLESELEKETEVEIKQYVDSIVKAAVAEAKAEILKELAVEVEVETEVAVEVEAEEVKEVAAETEVETEEVKEATEEELETIKQLTDTITQLKALAEEIK